MTNIIHLRFKSIQKEIQLDFSVLPTINNDISSALFNHQYYEVQSNVSDAIFQSFIDYVFKINQQTPNITIENIDEYYILNQEFQNSGFGELINEKWQSFNEFITNLHHLRNVNILDKSDIEQHVAEKLDIYVEQYSENLFSLPIQSLTRIFCNRHRVLSEHNRSYELIISQYNQNHDPNIFILLLSLDLDKLNNQNQRESVELQSERYGMMPRMTASLLSNNGTNNNDNNTNNNDNNTNNKNEKHKCHRRLQTELNKAQRDLDSTIFTITSSDDLQQWTIRITGPINSPYEGGILTLKFHFPKDFPHSEPSACFIPPVFHPNVGIDGCVCIKDFYYWSPTYKMVNIINNIYEILSNPQSDMSLPSLATDLYYSDRNEFLRRAREWTQAYAH